MAKRIYEFSLFAGMPHGQIDKLLEKLESRTYKRAEPLLKQGSKFSHITLLVEGRVSVVAESREGKKMTFVFHDAPYIFGHLEAWAERKNLASVIAMERCTTLLLSRNQYLGMLQSSHQLSINMVKMLSKLFSHASNQQYVRFFGQVDHLVANTLCSFARLYGEERGDGILIRRDLSKSEIAAILGIARRTVIRAFQTLEEEGLIHHSGKELIVPDISALQRKAFTAIP